MRLFAPQSRDHAMSKSVQSPASKSKLAVRPAAQTGVASSYRLLHTMIRVLDLEKSLDFYTRHLGMKLLRRNDYPSGEFTLAFVGYGDEADHTAIELTHNWGQKEPYAIGNAFGHLAVSVPDIYATCESLAKEGVKIPRPPGPMKHGTTVIAFIEDPDGYKIELIERKPAG
jgi:lactoylglutathione lyase